MPSVSSAGNPSVRAPHDRRTGGEEKNGPPRYWPKRTNDRKSERRAVLKEGKNVQRQNMKADENSDGRAGASVQVEGGGRRRTGLSAGLEPCVARTTARGSGWIGYALGLIP